MIIQELIKKIEKWAIDRELDKNGTVEGQLIKTAEETSELIIGISKGNLLEIKDAIGDVFVTLVVGCLICDRRQNLLNAIYRLNRSEEIGEYADKYEYIKNLMCDCTSLLVDKNYNQDIHMLLTRIIMVSEFYNLDFVYCVESAYKEIAGRKGVVRDGTFIKEDDLIWVITKNVGS